jgi:hypothetical protein
LKTAIKINRNLFQIYILFTREPFVQYFSEELEYFSNGNGELLGLISLDLTDKDYYACILSRDESKQFRAEIVEASILTIEEARNWIDEKMSTDSIARHESANYFDIFKKMKNDSKMHPHYKLLLESVGLLSAKKVLSEISYHYKDIDGNFVDQFQSLNGFDARIWELFLFCFFREQFFSFQRNFESPDFLIEKFNEKIAIEAVVVSRKKIIAESYSPKDEKEIEKLLNNEVPLMFASALFDKVKKKYWEKDHVKGLAFVIAIADFHDTMSMTWSFNSLIEYLYGFKHEHSLDEKGNLEVKLHKIKNYKKANETEIPSGFFFQPGNENVSAVIFSSCGTLSKFNRMGKQAGLGSDKNILIRMGSYYNHEENAAKPNIKTYEVNESSDETWSEGVIIYHNPNALIPLEPNLFDEKVAQTFFQEEKNFSFMPKVYPYNSFTQNLIIKEK